MLNASLSDVLGAEEAAVTQSAALGTQADVSLLLLCICRVY